MRTILFCLIVAIGSTSATELTPEKILDVRRLSDLQLSPDGSRLAFAVAEPVKGTEQNLDIWVLDIQSRDARPFTGSKKSDSRPRWSPDGRHLGFLSNRDGPTQIYLLSLEGGEARSLTEGKNAVRSFEFSPDGRRVAFIAPEPKSEEDEKKEKEKNDARVVDKDDRRPQLWVVDVETEETRQLTKGAWRIAELAWTPRGDRLVVSATEHPQPELETQRIYTVQSSDGAMSEVANPTGPFGNIDVSPDGKWITYFGSRGDGPTPHDLYLQPFSGGEPKNLTADSIDRPVLSYVWQDDGSSILALVQTGFTNTFFVVDENGRAEKKPGFEVHPGTFATGSDILAFIGESTTQPQEIWLSRGSERAEAVTDLNETRAQIAAVRPEVVRYSSFDGTEIEAALLKPPAYQGGGRAPLVVLIHGGPSGRWMDRFDTVGQLLAANGFAVFQPNIRGSTGYGHDFLVMNREDWGGGDYKDVIAGVDYLIEQGITDADRLGIGGWSYGGYMAAWAVTQTDRFHASVSGAPMTDLASEYGTESASINAYDTWYLGTPYENLDIFTQRSPVTHVKNTRTPTLILCGENDVTDPIGQCQQFYRGLKRYEVETELVIYPREGHGIREEKHQVDRLQRYLDWFKKYLK
jgi:dipeptidyl aminopeptidase/acylaminoacyl peptidase